MKPAKYFFSYSRVDSDFVKKLATDLRNSGADVWLDQLDIVPGTEWDVSIQNALNEADGVLAIVTDTSINSKNVMDEVSYAISQDKRIIPLLLENYPLPFRLARLQHVDFTGDYDSALEYLLKALKAPGIPESNVPVQPVSSLRPSNRKSPRQTIIITMLILIAALLAIFLFRNNNDVHSGNTYNDTTSGNHQATNTDIKPGVATDAATDHDRINLFADENGGRVLVASSDDWRFTIDGDEGLRQISYGIGKEAVYGFRDERAATFDMFTMLITETETFNIKEFELLAGDDSPTGQFRSIGKFQTQNVKLFKTPYQEFKFHPVTAKYLKFKLISTYEWPHPNIHEFQLFGILK